MVHPATLKIACLHGYCQNAQLLRLKTGGLRKFLQRTISAVREHPSSSDSALQSPMAELYYINAPFVLEPRPNAQPLHSGQCSSENDSFDACFRPVPFQSSVEASSDPTKRTWWVAQNNGKLSVGWAQSLQYLRDIFREEQFHGILGFSQGAIVTSLICALRNDATAPYPEFSSLRFAIMVSGFPARATALQYLYDKPIAMPSMHVWGVEDKMVPSSASRLLLEKFQEPGRNCVVHPKGHLVPSDANSRQAISRFVLRFSEELNGLCEEQLRAAL